MREAAFARPVVANPGRAGHAHWLTDLLAKSLVVATAMNLNGVMTMAFGVGQAVSLLMLASALYLAAKYGRFAMNATMVIMLVTVAGYLVLGTIYTPPEMPLSRIAAQYQTYLGTVLIILAMGGYVVHVEFTGQLGGFIRFVRSTLLVSALSVWASPVLYRFYVNVPPSFENRMSGFFGNPNEAGIIGAAALSLVLAMPYRNKLLQAAAVALAVGAIALTFSKTAMMIGVLLLALAAIRAFRGVALVLAPAVAMMAIMMVQQPREVFDAIADQTVIELSAEQQRRVRGLGDLMTGEVNADVTTGRLDLWGIGIARAEEILPNGSGLYSYHFLEGGEYTGEYWLGVHNAFLMFWGEGGLFVGLLFAGFVVVLAWSSVRRSIYGFESFFVLTLFAQFMATHSALALRYTNLLIGLIIGLSVVAASRAAKQRQAEARRSVSPPPQRFPQAGLRPARSPVGSNP